MKINDDRAGLPARLEIIRKDDPSEKEGIQIDSGHGQAVGSSPLPRRKDDAQEHPSGDHLQTFLMSS
jgi:hypothetical protein